MFPALSGLPGLVHVANLGNHLPDSHDPDLPFSFSDCKALSNFLYDPSSTLKWVFYFMGFSLGNTGIYHIKIHKSGDNADFVIIGKMIPRLGDWSRRCLNARMATIDKSQKLTGIIFLLDFCSSFKVVLTWRRLVTWGRLAGHKTRDFGGFQKTEQTDARCTRTTKPNWANVISVGCNRGHHT